MSKIYTSKDVSQLFGVSVSTVNKTALKLGYVPYKYKFGTIYRFAYEDVQVLKNALSRPKAKRRSKLEMSQEVIYVTRESHYFESKSNYFSDKKVNKLLKNLVT